MEHDCNQCRIAKLCTRHPNVNKSGIFGAICRGEGDPRVQRKWLDKWDTEAGIAPEDRPRKQGCCGPSALKQVSSLLGAVAKWMASGGKLVPAEIAQERQVICEACPDFKDDRCQQCGCFLAAKTQLPHEQCPSSKWIQWLPTSKKTPEPRWNLIYHIWPTHNGLWQWNVAQLLRRIDLFDGVRSIAVATGPGTHSLEDVKAAFAGHRIDNWIEVPNNPKIREGSTFIPLMQTLPQGPDNVTFYAHAKGVRHGDVQWPKLWAQTMYETCLDDRETVRRGLESFPMIGPFRKFRQPFKLRNNHRWHYSGTFFWFRNEAVFSRDWRRLAPGFFSCVEAWPANIFDSHEVGCLFGDDAGDLYMQHEWAAILPNLEAWKHVRNLQ